VQQQQRRAQAELAACHPGCAEVDQVVVDDEAEQRQQQVPVAGAARVGRRQADAQQHQVGGTEEQAETPRQFTLVAQRRLVEQVDRAHGPWRLRLGALECTLAGEHAVAVEIRQRLVPVAAVGLVALTALEHHPALVVDGLQSPALGRRHRLTAAIVGQDEDIACIDRLGALALDEEDALAVARRLEDAGRDARQIRALFIALAQLAALPVPPRPDEQHQQHHHQQHRPAHAQDRAHEAVQRHAAGKPDRHLAVAVHAAQADDDGDEQRQRQHRRQVA
jgi:hypothetical protein